MANWFFSRLKYNGGLDFQIAEAVDIFVNESEILLGTLHSQYAIDPTQSISARFKAYTMAWHNYDSLSHSSFDCLSSYFSKKILGAHCSAILLNLDWARPSLWFR